MLVDIKMGYQPNVSVCYPILHWNLRLRLLLTLKFQISILQPGFEFRAGLPAYGC